MTMFEEASGLYTMIKMRKMTQNEIAELLGVSQSYIANKLRLLKLSKKVQELIISLGLTERHARALLPIKDEKILIETIEKVHNMSLSVAATEALVDAVREPRETINPSCGLYSGVELFENKLREGVRGLKALGVDVDFRTSFYEKTRYITIAIME